MHDDRRLVEQRLERALRERIEPACYPTAVPLDVAVWHAPGEPVPVRDGLTASYEPIAVGAPWGRPWGTSWFRLRGTVPPRWSGRPVQALFDPGFSGKPGFAAEGLVYRADGSAIKGLNPRSRWIPVGDPAHGGETVELYVEAASNPLVAPPVTDLGDLRTAGDHPLYRLNRADLAVFDRQVWELVQDLAVLGELMYELSTAEPRRHTILRAIEAALDALDLTDVPGTAAAARQRLAPALAAPAHSDAHRVSAIGHAHIDSAWLWPLRETVRKVARTCANVTALMDDHPELVFAMSQAQQLAWLAEHRPEVFARVKEKVAAGTFVPVGGMWVEADTNMPCGEAMARQFGYGKRFYLDEFGIETQEVWLPDSFGYSAALPQLVKLSGSRWFLTQKISWNATNHFPHHTFWWEGIDGTRIFTHFPPVDTYNAELTGAELAHAVRNYAEKGRANRSLVPFGHGDGGGGPTREMLARARRLADLAGSARVTIERPADFFAAAHREYPDAPVWAGELYLELHRGTYTSQAATKRGNRSAEHRLREAELWCATAAVRTSGGYQYPYDRLDAIWRTVLLHQFHDILPGSSIAWVHREARDTYARVDAELRELIGTAQRALAAAATTPDPHSGAEPATGRPRTSTGPDAESDDTPAGGAVLFNATPHDRDGVPALGAGPAARPAGRVTITGHDGGYLLDNGPLRVTVDDRGLLTSVWDRAAGRDAVAPDRPAGLLQSHPDLPNHWDAWDVDAFYRNTVNDLTGVDELSVLVDDRPVAPGGEPVAGARAGVRVVRSFSSSRVVQLITLDAGRRRVDIETTVDWRESERLLKLAFPLDVRAEYSSAETQFGHVRRAAHTNTSWDAARFELCAHRFLHVGEVGYGVALVNDATYGHDVTRDVRADGGTTTTVRASLLRAPRYPDPRTDHGEHRFRHALVPGATIADAAREGYAINLPPTSVAGAWPVEPLVGVSGDAVLVESVKLADDRGGDVIVRLYEALGGRATTELRCTLPVTAATEIDLLERPLPDADPVPLADGAATLTFRPFQIRTLRLHRR